MEEDLNGRQTQWKTNSMEDTLNGRQPQWKTTSIEDDFNGKHWEICISAICDVLQNTLQTHSYVLTDDILNILC